MSCGVIFRAGSSSVNWWPESRQLVNAWETSMIGRLHAFHSSLWPACSWLREWERELRFDNDR